MPSSPAMELYNTAEVVLPGESVDGDRHGAVGRDRLQDLVLFANQTGDLQDIVPVTKYLEKSSGKPTLVKPLEINNR